MSILNPLDLEGSKSLLLIKGAVANTAQKLLGDTVGWVTGNKQFECNYNRRGAVCAFWLKTIPSQSELDRISKHLVWELNVPMELELITSKEDWIKKTLGPDFNKKRLTIPTPRSKWEGTRLWLREDIPEFFRFVFDTNSDENLSHYMADSWSSLISVYGREFSIHSVTRKGSLGVIPFSAGCVLLRGLARYGILRLPYNYWWAFVTKEPPRDIAQEIGATIAEANSERVSDTTPSN